MKTKTREELIEQALRDILENAWFNLKPEAFEKWAKDELNVNSLRANAEKALNVN